jgi:hypothetical protein
VVHNQGKGLFVCPVPHDSRIVAACFSEHNGYLERHRQATAQVDELEAAKQERLAKSKTLDIFIRDIKKRTLALTEWDESLWLAVIDKVTVATAIFTFRNGAEVTA